MVITAVVFEGRTQGEVARAYSVSQGWVSRLVSRYRAEGAAAFQPRSRRPLTSPTAIDPAVVEAIVTLRKHLTEQGLDAGPATIAWHLQHRHQLTVSNATIARTLTREGLITPEPKKRPKASYTRFAADLPNETWQSDVTHYRLADGLDAEIITWLDDCTRYALSVTAHRRVTGPIVLATFRASTRSYGVPASTLTDNGMVFTTRLSGGKGGRNGLETELRRLDVVQKNSRPHHPTTCGKVERFQQTLKDWLRAQPRQPHTIEALQNLIDAFIRTYNTERPHSSLPHRATPAAIYTTLPKATPTTSRDGDTHNRVRHDVINASGTVTLRVHGRLHHIGIGRTYARTRVLVLAQDLQIRIVATATGELLRELTLDPTKDYQPTGQPAWKPQNPEP